MNRNLRLQLGAALLSTIGCWFVGLAAAGDTPPARSSSDEQLSPDAAQALAELKKLMQESVDVTVEKRTETQARVPAAVTVLSGQELTDRGLLNIQDATVMFPSAKLGGVQSSTHLYIRGIGAEQDRASIDPLSAMTENGVNLPREVTGNHLFDVQSIQLLPGPQSTLYGTGAAGGTINVLDNRPTHTASGSALLDVSNFSYAHGTVVDNLPLSETSAMRVALDYANRAGFYTSSGSVDQFGGRLSWLYEPTSDFSAYVWGSYNSTGGSSANTTTLTGDHRFADPNNPWNDFTCAPSGEGFPLGANPSCDPFYIGKPKLAFNTSIASAQLDWHVHGVTFTLIPSALYDKGSELQYFGPFSNEQHIWNRQFSNELRVASDAVQPVKWLGGVYWYRDAQYQFFNINGSPGNPILWNNEQTYAAFGQVTYSLNEHLRVSAGGRFSSNQKSGNGCNCAAGDGEGVFFTFHHTWPRFDWKLGLEKDLGDRTLAYATVQTGYTNGAYQYYNEKGLLGAGNVGPAPLVAPSLLTSYSAGTKSNFLSHHLELNNEVYYYNYKNLLIAPFDDNPSHFGNSFYNARKVEIFGDELTARFLLTPSNFLTASVAYNRARAVDFIVGDPPVNLDGLQLIAAPDVTINAGYRHVWSLSSGASFAAQVDTHYENGFWGTFNHSPSTHQQAFTRTDSRIEYNAPRSKWSFQLWVTNIENRAVITNGAFVGAGAVQGVYWLLPPRTYGARLLLTF